MEKIPRQVAVFGSTGSIGTQCLEIIESYPEYFKVSVLVAGRNKELLIKQVLKFNPKIVAIEDKNAYAELRKILPKEIELYSGMEAIADLAYSAEYDIILMAVTGCVAMPLVFQAIRSGRTIALSNKESMVVAGEILIKEAKKTGARILPVDSEHAAIFQCLLGENPNYNEIVSSVILTASGGPFKGKKTNFLEKVRPLHALAHPVWSMGAKVTIDSATLMNKGLELMEARWLFGIEPKKIDALVHSDAIAHCIVSFIDGSAKVQLAASDMRIPIQNSLSFPHKLPNKLVKNFKPYNLNCLRFETIDERTFRCFALAKKVFLQDDLKLACLLNAANEIAVSAFLQEHISFIRIADVIDEVLNKFMLPNLLQINIEHLLEIDSEARLFTEKIIKKYC